ncbi:glycosyltransferase family 2 protein [Leptothermofonsia sp. ETS-13]|uniref:glycosyltransferase family 2 protein n=1 Tax=Leptothermofonsia sp. ETS-13 TaxID=3035696 RepID=UPI003B9E5B80
MTIIAPPAIAEPLNLDRVFVIIPALNEEATIASVIQDLQSQGLTQIRVVDNGSTDRTCEKAQAAGAEVIQEPITGYGRACWRGLQHLPPEVDWILFCDGDGSDDLSQLPQFFAGCSQFDLILGDRRATEAGRAALTPVQNFGNWLATFLIQLGWGYQYQDLGPLRLIRRAALEQLQMGDRGFGWTVEMQVRAIKCGLRICELPVNYHPRRGGKSKISGTLSGSFKAGTVILGTLGRLYFCQKQQRETEEHGALELWGNRIQQAGVFNPPKLLWLTAILLVLGSLLLLPYGDLRSAHFWVGVAVMGCGFALSWILPSVSALWFWGVTILTRLILLPMYPGDDVWRYLWEGYIQNQGFSPYHFAPDAPELANYRTLWWEAINHPNVTAIYPPIAQMGFRLLAAISPSVMVFKMGFVLADLGVCWLLSRRFSYQQTTLYAWNPLIIYSFAGGAHYDSWFILPLVAARLIFDTSRFAARWVWSALLVGVSIGMKWMSLPVLGFLVWSALRKWRIELAVAVLLVGCLPFVLTALPFCYSGTCPLIPVSSTFVRHGRSAEFIPYLVRQVWLPSLQANWLYAIPLGMVVIGLLWRARSFYLFTEWYLFALLLLSPIVHAWYFTWMIPFAIATGNLGVRLVSLSAFVYFVLPHRLVNGNFDWHLSEGERWLLWLPLVLGWLWTVGQQEKLWGVRAWGAGHRGSQ